METPGSATAPSPSGPFAVGDLRRHRTCSLAQQIRRAAMLAESEELGSQRRQLQEDLDLVKDLMARQQQEQEKGLEDLWQLHLSMERATLKASAAEQEQHKVAQVLKEEMNLCREGQNDVARQVLAKMAELNEKLGANMATLEDEVIGRFHETLERLQAEELRRSQCEEECREALDQGRLAQQKVQACEEVLAEKAQRCAAEVQRNFSALVETTAAVTSMRRDLAELRQPQVCSGCHEVQHDLKQIGLWLTEVLGLPEGLATCDRQTYQAPWLQQQEDLQRHEAELQSQRTLLDQLASQLQEVKTSELQRQAAMESMVTKQCSSLQNLRQKVAKERKDEASRRASWEEEFSKLRGQVEQDLLDVRKAQAESSVAHAAAVEEKQQALLRHCRAWAVEAQEVAKEALEDQLRKVAEDLRGSQEASARETKQQCRGWVDAALGKLETLAIRSREQLATLSAELPFTVKRLVTEEMAKLRKTQPTATQPHQRKVLKAEKGCRRPETPPFELGEPMADVRPAGGELVADALVAAPETTATTAEDKTDSC